MSLCVYCNQPADTRDHVPPKGLFSRPRPENLITVPACLACNSGASGDDEYFRICLTTRVDTHEHPEAQAVLPTVMRAFAMPEQAGLRSTVHRSLVPLALPSDDGSRLGTAHGFRFQPLRLHRVISRTVRGLFWFHTAQILPPSHDVWATSFMGLSLDKAADTEAIAAQFMTLPWSPGRQIRGDAFMYGYYVFPEVVTGSAWLFTFYGAATFIALTHSRGA